MTLPNCKKILLAFSFFLSLGQAQSSENPLFSADEQSSAKGYMILGGPAVSSMILKTLEKNKTHVLNLSTDKKVSNYTLELLDEETFFTQVKKFGSNPLPLMINSEFAQQIVGDKASFSSSYDFASYFRSKTKFREWLHDVFPDFFFKKGTLEDFSNIQASDDIPYPLIIKPSTGYLSLCVHKVDSYEDLQEKLNLIRQSSNQIQTDYPKAMVDCDNLIMEKFIKGPEVAVEGYYNAEGHPVVFNIMARTFKDDADTSGSSCIAASDIPVIILEALQASDASEEAPVVAEVAPMASEVDPMASEVAAV